jgi:transcription factor HY5
LAARRAKRKAERGEDDSQVEEELSHEQEQHIEAQIASAGSEKEAKRLKRLLRNRVSAQQARERKKSYLTNLEDKAREQDQQIEQLQQRVKTLERENVMLRQVIKNMQGRS